ncbi:MAG: gamma-glutamylcyclotransferase [Anaerolineae bacterium]|jgi:gamma-glutamylcyclotransferase (GGCT)/AIG2-like uncharacterized protein YtfP
MWSNSSGERVFVYGTLRPPRPGRPAGDTLFYERIAAHVRCAIPARLPGAILFDLGAYPAARPGEGLLQGDLLTVEPPALALMDRIEGHPDFFRRARVRVQTGDGPLEAWIYWAGEALVAGKPRIVEGDWFARGG